MNVSTLKGFANVSFMMSMKLHFVDINMNEIFRAVLPSTHIPDQQSCVVVDSVHINMHQFLFQP